MSTYSSDSVQEEKHYIIEKLLAKRRNLNRTWEYLPDWTGFPGKENTWIAEENIDPDLITDFKRHQDESTGDNSIPIEASLIKSPLYTKKRRISSSPTRQLSGVEKGWCVQAVVGACKLADSSIMYKINYVQGSPMQWECIPSEIAHIYLPHKLIEYFQNRIVWKSSISTKSEL